MARMSSNKPNAAGRLSLTSGMREPCIALADLAGAAELITLPQTRQRVAFSLRRVPQVGHSLLEREFLAVIWFDNPDWLDPILLAIIPAFIRLHQYPFAAPLACDMLILCLHTACISTSRFAASVVVIVISTLMPVRKIEFPHM